MNHLRNAKEGMEEMYRLSSHPDVTKEGQANGNLAIIAHALIAIAEQLEDANRFKAMELEASGLIKKKENK